MSSNSLPVGIKFDPGDAVAKAKAVEDALHKTEDRGIAAGKAMHGLAGAFSKLREALEQERAALDRTHAAHDRLTRASQPLVQGFASLAEAIERERDMLERIQGPMKQYESELQTLDSLLDRNKISTEEYAAQVERLNRSLASTPKQSLAVDHTNPALAMETIGLPAPTSVGLQFGPEAALGGVGAGLAGFKMLDSAVEASREMEDRVTELTNKAQKFAVGFRNVNEVIDQQVHLASDLHTTAGQVIEVYDSVGDATENLNLSISEQNDLTKTLGQSALLAGNSLDAVGSSIQGIGAAWETGGDVSKQLRSFLRDNHDLAVELESTLNMTSRQIIEAAKSGELSYGKFVRAVIEGGHGLTDTFGKISETHKEWKAQAVEGFERAKVAGDDFISSLKAGVDEANGKLKQNQHTFGEWFTDLSTKLNQIEDDAERSFKLFTQGALAMGRSTLELLSGVADAVGGATGAIAENAKAWHAVKEEVSAYTKLLQALQEPQRKAIEEYNLLSQALMNHPELYREINIELGKRRDILLDLGFLETKSVTSGVAAPVNDTAGIDTETLVQHASGVDYLTAAWKRELEANQQASEEAEKIGAMFSPLKDVIVDMFKDGEINANRFLDVLADVAIKLLEISAINAITGGVGGSTGGFLKGLLGGANGFDYTASNDPFQRPGFANGGDALMGGTGGTDSKLAMWWMTPGESLHVRTPSQRAEAAKAQSGGDTQVLVQVKNNERDIEQTMGGYRGRRVIANLPGRNRGRGPARMR